MYETVFLHLSASLRCLCPWTFFLKNELDKLPWASLISNLHRKLRIFNVPSLAADDSPCGVEALDEHFHSCMVVHFNYCFQMTVSGVGIHNNRAFIDKFLKFCMHVGMGQRFSKLIASKLGSPSGGRYMQNPRWPPPRIVTDVSNWNLQPYTFVIPFFLGFQVWQIHFKAYLRYSWSFKRSRAHFLIIYYEKRKQVAIHHFLMHTNHHWIMLKFIPNHRATWCYIVVTL